MSSPRRSPTSPRSRPASPYARAIPCPTSPLPTRCARRSPRPTRSTFPIRRRPPPASISPGVIEKLGLSDQVADRLRLGPNGATAMRALAVSTARRPIGCTQETEIRATQGVVLVAPLPPGCDLVTTYTAAITTRAQATAEAATLVAALAGGRGH